MGDGQFQLGDVVRLKSGGPEMTVEWVGVDGFTNQPVIQCKWFDSDNKLHTQGFGPDTLMRAKKK